MDFVQYLDVLSNLDQQGIKDMPDYQQIKKNISSVMNDIILHTELISDKYKRKKAVKKLGVMTDCVDAIFESLDTLYEHAQNIKDKDEWSEKAYRCTSRIKRQLELCSDADKELKKILN